MLGCVTFELCRREFLAFEFRVALGVVQRLLRREALIRQLCRAPLFRLRLFERDAGALDAGSSAQPRGVGGTDALAVFEFGARVERCGCAGASRASSVPGFTAAPTFSAIRSSRLGTGADTT